LTTITQQKPAAKVEKNRKTGVFFSMSRMFG
jgi:hypothetical protein